MLAVLADYLKDDGWKAYSPADRFISSDGDRAVDLSGDFGYAWELYRIADDGLLYVQPGAEGDTLEELQAALHPGPISWKCLECGGDVTDREFPVYCEQCVKRILKESK